MASTALSGIVFAFLLYFPVILIVLMPFCVDYREFLYPKSTRLVQILIFQVHIITNILYIKCLSQFYVFFTFLGNLTIFINFALTGNDSCHSHLMQCIFTSHLLFDRKYGNIVINTYNLAVLVILDISPLVW